VNHRAVNSPPPAIHEPAAFAQAEPRVERARPLGWRAAIAAVVLVFLGHLTAVAQPSSGVRSGGGAGAPAQPSTDSPRASLAQFLELARQGRYTEAGTYLDLPAPARPRAGELARRLKAVLDRHVWLDLDAASASPHGNVSDGLPIDVEEIARIPGAGGEAEPVRLTRSERNGGGWSFTRETVSRVDAWYDRLEQRWLREHLPPALLAPGPKELLWWQWLALPLILIGAWLGGALLSRLSRRLLGRIARRTSADWDDAVIARMGAPLTLGWTIALAYLAVPWLGLYAPALQFVNSVLRGSLFVVFFWSLARAVDVGGQMLIRSSWGVTHAASRSLVAVGARTGKLLILAIAVVALLSELGYPVASLIAGLGIGGLAVALAAQKTVENLFGTFSIAADQPFREGDFVKVEDFVGTVETIGLRSTKIRTLDRTLITVPNGRLAEMRLETFAARDRIRLHCVLGLVYATSSEQMQRILAELERVLRAHPKTWQETVLVRFREFGASSLDVEVMAWFETSDYGEFQLHRQEVLLQFMKVVEQAGSSFAFPTRTVHVVDGQRFAVDAARRPAEKPS